MTALAVLLVAAWCVTPWLTLAVGWHHDQGRMGAVSGRRELEA